VFWNPQERRFSEVAFLRSGNEPIDFHKAIAKLARLGAANDDSQNGRLVRLRLHGAANPGDDGHNFSPVRVWKFTLKIAAGPPLCSTGLLG